MAPLIASSNVRVHSLAVSSESLLDLGKDGRIGLTKSGVTLPCLKSHQFRGVQCLSQQRRGTLLICASAALNARCAAEQTQTVTRQSSTVTIAPIQGKEKSPELDDGGTGLPPRDDNDGGGGGGGGGPGWSGGFFFFGFLAFLGFLQDKEKEGDYGDQKKRYNRSY